MKSANIVAWVAICALTMPHSAQDNLQYNFEIKNGKNTLVVSKQDQAPAKKQATMRHSRNTKPKHSLQKKKSSSNDELSKMVKLGTLIDRITDRLEQDSKKKKKSPTLKSKKKSKKSRKAMGLGGMAAIGGVAAAGVGAGMMAGAADNDKIQTDIDKYKMREVGLYISDRIGEESLTWLSKANRGFAVLKVKATVLMNNFSQKYNIVYDHLSTMLDDMETDYDNIGVKPKQ